MPSKKKLDPTGERAEATEAMESTPISGKEHEYLADGDHRPRQNAETPERAERGKAASDDPAATNADTAPKAGVESERHISEGIPGAGQSPEVNSMPDAQRKREKRS